MVVLLWNWKKQFQRGNVLWNNLANWFWNLCCLPWDWKGGLICLFSQTAGFVYWFWSSSTCEHENWWVNKCCSNILIIGISKHQETIRLMLENTLCFWYFLQNAVLHLELFVNKINFLIPSATKKILDLEFLLWA